MTSPLLYDELVPWYLLLDPTADHEAEATSYVEAFRRHVSLPAGSLLDLGSGAGNNATFLAPHFARATLVDLSPRMLETSMRLNPGAEHVEGDIRTVRLGRTFDAVLVHDAIMYMTTEADLREALTTAFVHTRPGGVAVLAPDVFQETFADETSSFEADHPDDGRSLRCLEWSWDPDPADTSFFAEYVFVLRDLATGTDVRVVHDRHVNGVFPRATWTRLLTEVGFEVGTFPRPLDDGETFDEVFVCRRPFE